MAAHIYRYEKEGGEKEGGRGKAETPSKNGGFGERGGEKVEWG